MTIVISRAEKAGRALGRSIIEMVNLMYQHNTSKNFLWGLKRVIDIAYRKRSMPKERCALWPCTQPFYDGCEKRKHNNCPHEKKAIKK